MSDLLLDTCALLWLADGAELATDARKAIADGNLNVSPISVWEIANLVRKKRIVLAMPVVRWIRQVLEKTEAAISDLSIEVLAGSCELPGSPPADPADRIIIATAREASLVLMTRDRDILTYARGGYLRTIAC
ncbi:MAG: type II toxin-antitoxin system VapC family toxin [Xanthobacteraceae bacterium]